MVEYIQYIQSSNSERILATVKEKKQARHLSVLSRALINGYI